MRRFAKYFFEGLIIVVPLAVTIYTFYFIFTKIDRLLAIPLPGMGFLITIIVITCIGFLASNIFTKRLLNLIDKIFYKLPLTRLLYTATKDLLTAFLGDKKSFEKPVFVTLFPGSSLKVIGFITKENLETWGVSDEVAVYLPQAYNFAGNLIIVPKDYVSLINASSSEVMAFIVSGGVVGLK